MNIREESMHYFKLGILSAVRSKILEAKFEAEIWHNDIPEDELDKIESKLKSTGIVVYTSTSVIRLNWRSAEVSLKELTDILISNG